MVHYNSSKAPSSEPCYCYGTIRNNYLNILIGCIEFIIYFFKKIGGVFNPVLGIGDREAINFNF